MITLENDALVIRFPHISKNAGIRINFQRTLRIPDDGQEHHLPPGLGQFPLRHIEDYDLGAREHRKARGGVIMPMFQTDALWLNFDAECDWPPLPVALKVGAGKINAVSGERWKDGLTQDPQDYAVLPDQPWLDGFNVSQGVIRQFVAMPLGQGYTVEEQIDPESDVGGIQIEAIPMKKKYYKKLIAPYQNRRLQLSVEMGAVMCDSTSHHAEMGLGMGGSMRQRIYEDEHGIDSWDLAKRQRCFVMLANAEQWIGITGEEPPLSPISAEEYTRAGLPWFDYYDGDQQAIEGAKALGDIKSIKALASEKREDVWSDKQFDLSNKNVSPIQGKVKSGTW